MDPEKYVSNVVYEKGKNVLSLRVLKYIYGILQSYLLSYIKMRKDLETDGFKFNPYDPCVANKIIKGDQLTILFHADDVKESHKVTKAVENFEQRIEFMYGDPKIEKVKLERGRLHEYLYNTKGEVKTDMWK